MDSYEFVKLRSFLKREFDVVVFAEDDLGFLVTDFNRRGLKVRILSSFEDTTYVWTEIARAGRVVTKQPDLIRRCGHRGMPVDDVSGSMLCADRLTPEASDVV